jgi:hypothetical protein
MVIALWDSKLCGTMQNRKTSKVRPSSELAMRLLKNGKRKPYQVNSEGILGNVSKADNVC